MRKMVLAVVTVCAFFAGCTAGASDIGEKKAREIALTHAGLNSEKVTFVKAEAERENGKKVYEVEFYTNDYMEYDYEIDAESGEILTYDSDAENYIPPSNDAVNQNAPQNADNTQQQSLSEEQAKKIALEKVPDANESNIREFEKDFDDGKAFYEGKIVMGNTEYEFEIDASNGNVIKWEKDSLYD